MKLALWLNGDITGSDGKGASSKVLRELAKHKKSYMITSVDYRTILSAAVNLVELKSNNIVFLTHTFPFDVTEHQANGIQKLFLKKFKIYWNETTNYIWTKERQKKGRLHFHTIIDMPFVPIQSLQGLWNHCISIITGNSVDNFNSLRLPLSSAKLYNTEVARTVRYIAKYISKERNKPFTQPCYGISKELYFGIKREIYTDEALILRDSCGFKKEYGGEHFYVCQLNMYPNENSSPNNNKNDNNKGILSNL